jgi:2-oxoglutarate ferredoxin oxidoreductase subunit gamma
LHHEVLIAGFGGQGVVLAGRLLAEAALAEGREVVWAPSYGPEMRGGPVHCTVIISSGRIGSPEVSLADSLLIMDRASLQRFSRRLRPGGLLVLNSTLVPVPTASDERKVLPIAATEAAEALGDARVANVVMIGAFLHLRPILTSESIEGAIQMLSGGSREHLIAMNRQALARGMELAGESQVGRP